MRRGGSLLILIIIIFSLFCSCSSSKHEDDDDDDDYLKSLPIRYDDAVRPGRRSLLSEDNHHKEKPVITALVADFDGTISLMKRGLAAATPEQLWSFSSGSQIYSSYHDTENLETNYYIDCGDDDFELYAHNRHGKLKLTKSVEEYINSTPQIADDGGIVLGSKKTSVFLVDGKTGRVINTFRMPDSSTSMHTTVNDSIYDTSVKHSGKMDQQLPLYITRTDYRLTSFIPNTDKVLWNVTVAEIGAAFLCQDEESTRGTPLKCQSRARVFRMRHHNRLQALIAANGLPVARQPDMMLPTSTSDILPSQPNVEKVLESLPSQPNVEKFLPSSHSTDRFLDAHDGQDLPDVNDDNFTTAHGEFTTSLLILFISLLVFVACHLNVFSRTKVIWAGASSTDKHFKRKRPRKSGKGGSNLGKQDKDENEAKHTPKETESNFWQNLNLPSFQSKDGRTIGKLFVSSDEIAKGSNGTIVLEGIYEGRLVAVKRLVRAYNDVAFKEIQNLIVSDRHPNIVRWYGVEQDQDFVYLALERCACSLNDLILTQLESSDISIPRKNLDDQITPDCTISSVSLKALTRDLVFWKSDGYPSPLLLKLMRDIISGIAHLHELGIVHRDLKPQNVLIIRERSLCAKLSDMGISKRLIGDMSSLTNHSTGYGSPGWQAPEQLLHGRQTRAVDLFSLGCILFFCITGGRHPFGNRLERDVNIANGKVDLFLVEHIPEAVDLLLRLLDPDAEMRPKAVEVLFHPLFWNAETRLSFLRDTSDRVELEDREINSDLLKTLESKVQIALGAKWNDKMEPSFLNNIGRYRRYKFDSVRDLLRVMRNKLNHYRELPAEIQEIIGPIPEGFNGYFASRFPKLLIEVYKIMLKHCSTEEWFAKYFRGTAAE